MSYTNDDPLPPLGERTPGRARRPPAAVPWYRRAPIVGLAGVLVGLALGLALSALSGTGHEQAPDGVGRPPLTTVPRTTTTAPSVPTECTEAIRSAQESLALLDRAFQTARQFDVGQLDQMLSELQQVRRALSDHVQACVDRS